MSNAASFEASSMWESTPMYLQGVFVEVFGKGILLTGQSGIGKSETALSLIDRGNYFVTDDVVAFHVSSYDKKIWGSCPSAELQGFLEVRGLGILNIADLFGESTLKAQAPLTFICEFVAASIVDRSERTQMQETLFEQSIPKEILPVIPGRNMALLVETLARLQ